MTGRPGAAYDKTQLNPSDRVADLLVVQLGRLAGYPGVPAFRAAQGPHPGVPDVRAHAGAGFGGLLTTT